MTRPDRTEAAEYYFGYIDKVTGSDICEILERQMGETLSFLESISDERSLFRYAPDKWSIREVVGHVNDAERLFASRAFWFGRGLDTPLPSFDQEVAMSLPAHTTERGPVTAMSFGWCGHPRLHSSEAFPLMPGADGARPAGIHLRSARWRI